MHRERVIDRRAHQVTEFRSVADFLRAATVPAGISTIYQNGLPIDLLVSPADSNTTVFFFHGAIEPHFQLPVLSGLGISGGLATNRVFVSDPSLLLDDQLMLAWYAGNYLQTDLQQVLTKIFQKIISDLGGRRTIFFGGSGGGFAALYFASAIPHSLALVFNPQTNIDRYAPRAVTAFNQHALGLQVCRDRGARPPSIVTDLCSHYSSGIDTTIAYMQNVNDTVHVEEHLRPFQMAVRSPTKLYLLMERWGEGHSPPPKQLLTHVLDISTASHDWPRNLQSAGFLPHSF